MPMHRTSSTLVPARGGTRCADIARGHLPLGHDPHMSVQPTQASSPSSARADRRGLILTAVVVAVVVIIGAYQFGSNRSRTRELVGPAQVGQHVASISADGTDFGVPSSVTWYDTTGTLHERGWPDCLGDPAPETPPVVRFGVTRVDYPDGSHVEQVTYIDCRN